MKENDLRMICNYVVNCPGCGAKVRLRISVGIEDPTYFFLVCPKCKAPTKIFHSSQSGLSLEYNQPIELGQDLKNLDGTITISSDFPSKPGTTSMKERYGSPFLANVTEMNRNILNYQDRISRINELYQRAWPDYKRMISYYLNQDWNNLKTTIEKISITYSGPLLLNNQFALKENWQYDHAVIELIHRFFAPLIKQELLIKAYEEVANIFGKTASDTTKASMLASYAREDDFSITYKKLFECIKNYVHCLPDMLPAFSLQFYKKIRTSSFRKLRIFRDDFYNLRDLYRNAYETFLDASDYLIIIQNIYSKGDMNKFPDCYSKNIEQLTNGKNKARDWKDYKKLGKAIRLKNLEHTIYPHLKEINNLLSSNLRNNIAHSDCHHDITKGWIYVNDKKIISYLEFADNCLKLISPLLIALSSLKLFNINKHFLENPKSVQNLYEN